jgi:hypothetical protein
MSDQEGDQGPQRPAGRRRPGWTAVRLGVLLAILAGLVLYLTLPGGATKRSAAACVAAKGVPEVEKVRASALGELRETVARVLPQRVGRLYEEGTVRASVAWTDDNPEPPALSPHERRPAGYEMRWWAPNGDDIVADVLVFKTPARASRYLALASSTRCREKASQQAAPRPPEARNLAWLNPETVLQADLFMARGARVYRVADAPAGRSAEEIRKSGGLAHAFATIDVLACLIPAANCTRVPNGTTA